MNCPQVVSAAEWQAAREELLVKEKELTRERDALTAERRRLPMVRVEKDYRFVGPHGEASLLDLFSPEGYPQDPPYSWWRLHDEYDDATRKER